MTQQRLERGERLVIEKPSRHEPTEEEYLRRVFRRRRLPFPKVLPDIALGSTLINANPLLQRMKMMKDQEDMRLLELYGRIPDPEAFPVLKRPRGSGVKSLLSAAAGAGGKR